MKLALVRDQYLNLPDIGNYYGVINDNVELLLCGTVGVDWAAIMEFYPKARPLCYDHPWEVLEAEPDVIDVPDPFYWFSQYFAERFPKTVVLGWENLPGKNYFSSTALKCLDDAWKCVGRSRLACEELKFNGVPAEKIRLIPGAVDTDFFAPSQSIEREKAVLFAGRITQEKGLLDVIWALKDSGIPLWIAGPGELSHNYQVWIERTGLTVSFLGYQNRHQLRDLLQRAMVLCVPSIPLVDDNNHYRQWCEQFGQIFIEAMACGLPVVSTTSGAIPEVVGDGGIVVPARDWHKLRSAIMELFNDQPCWQTTSNIARNLAVTRFSMPVIGQQIREWYEL